MQATSADLDSIDRQLLALLKRDARQPVLALARGVGLSRSAVQDRLARLRETGVIKRFTIDTTGPAEDGGTRAYLFVRGDGRPCSRVVPGFAGLPEVESCDHVAGSMDVVLTVRAKDMPAISALRDRILAMPGIATVAVAVVMKSYLAASPAGTGMLAPAAG